MQLGMLWMRSVCVLLVVGCGAHVPCYDISLGLCGELRSACSLQLRSYRAPSSPSLCRRFTACCGSYPLYTDGPRTRTYARSLQPAPAVGLQQPPYASYGPPASLRSVWRDRTRPLTGAGQRNLPQSADTQVHPNALPTEDGRARSPLSNSSQSPGSSSAVPSEAGAGEGSDDCGRPGRTVRQRINTRGEHDADPARWPWMLLLGRRPGTGVDGAEQAAGPQWTCGAVLVTQRHALTVAHCVFGEPAGRLLLRLGEYDLSTRSDGAERDVAVRRVSIHPEYRRRHNDLAVLELAEPATLSDRVQPVCLPAAGAHHQQPLWVAGWGRVEFFGVNSDVLQEARLSLVSAADCETIYRTLPDFERSFPGGFNGTKLCATDPLMSGADACMGDSGGPLVVMRPDGCYQLAGLVSVGVGCGDPRYPGVYTRVSSYVDWLMSVIS